MSKCSEREGKGPARAYWHEVILYPEDADTARVLDTIEREVEEWVAVQHDLDAGDGGELKKAHIHVLMHSPTARTASAVGKVLRLPPERVELKSSGEDAQAYLTHSTEKARREGKHLYPAESLWGPLAGSAARAAEKASGGGAPEGVQVLRLLDWIEEQPGPVTVAQVARWAAKAGLWATFRRAGVIFRGCIDEHNQEAARREEAHRAAEARAEIDPLRFAKLKAGLVKPGPGKVVGV